MAANQTSLIMRISNCRLPDRPWDPNFGSQMSINPSLLLAAIFRVSPPPVWNPLVIVLFIILLLLLLPSPKHNSHINTIAPTVLKFATQVQLKDHIFLLHFYANQSRDLAAILDLNFKIDLICIKNTKSKFGSNHFLERRSMLLHANCQGQRPCQFWEEDF